MRAKNTPQTRKRRKNWIKLAKGYWGHKSIGYKVAKQAVVKSWTYAFRDRKQLKRDYRSLWVTRINAACKKNNISYSRFMCGLKRANINLNRKVISEVAIHQPDTFLQLLETSKKHLN